ncbi:M56 family metallopeptidase [Bacteroides sp.]|uniref:M56 family metallopeptidase n=1 Tax=Bacteroides sp. TaxID=29523 RepID=UPI0026193D0A|nr:M56 family metallopeptidase [Bacteroides sp.]MDD3039405.1 M56 family metallopeptidase [Bacteroides sp.]
MTPELTYFLKINVAIALFYAFYRLFFYKDTFFRWRRTALLCFFAISILYPLLNIQEWIKANEPMVAMADLYATIILPEQTIVMSPETNFNWQELLTLILEYVYWGVLLLLLLRFLIQLGSIIRLHFQCSKSNIQGTNIHLLKKESGPFSFFNWIFIYPPTHTESEISEIITHEKTHARQYHSADVLISEIISIACWFNPFIWLMKREVRSNLEYMADHQVLKTGHDSKSYQYHLLGLAHHKAAANLSNSFNVLPLKNRIKMMNKRRTKGIGRTKYLMFLPLAILLMIVSNIEVVARTTTKFAKEMIDEVFVQSTPSPAEVTIPQIQESETPKIAKPQQQKVAQQTEIAATKDTIPEDVVFEVVEQMPQFPGGQKAFMQFLGRNIKYPTVAHAKGTQGRVIVQFVVGKDGSISDIKAINNVDPYLDKEAERIISSMPKWIPGQQRGKTVRVKYTVPIMFRLSGPTAETKLTALTGNVSPSLPLEEVKKAVLSEVVVVGYAPTETSKEEPVADTIEKMPKFPGGEAALMQFLAKSIKYPTIAQKNKEQGKVILRMTVGKDGKISNINVQQSVSPHLDAEAIRVVSTMPEWEPGEDKGQPVNVEFTLPITFRLQ